MSDRQIVTIQFDGVGFNALLPSMGWHPVHETVFTYGQGDPYFDMHLRRLMDTTNHRGTITITRKGDDNGNT